MTTREEQLRLARQLELEYICEHCHRRPATLIFDNKLVCARCQAALDARLEHERRRP